MRRAVLGGLLSEAVFQAAFLLSWVTGSMTAAAVAGAVTGFAVVRFLSGSAAFRPLRDTLLWLGAALSLHLLTEGLGVPLRFAGWCVPSIRVAGGFTAAEGLAVVMVTTVFTAAAAAGYGIGLFFSSNR